MTLLGGLPDLITSLGTDLQSFTNTKKSYRNPATLKNGQSPFHGDRIQAIQQGHEIANHSYSHPIGLSKLNPQQIRDEIHRCSKLIESITGTRPVGFRAPSYDMDEAVLDQLEEMSFEYDSSAFWSSLQSVSKLYHRCFSRSNGAQGFGQGNHRLPRKPYYPAKGDWMSEGAKRNIIELPLPRTQLLQLPFYSNFHLSAGNWYRKCAVEGMKDSYLIYLFHLIEFVDLSDWVPSELNVHPNLKKSAKAKMAANEDTIKRLLKRYTAIKTVDFVRNYRASHSDS